MREQWKPITDYEGLYEISSCGRVWCVAARKFKDQSGGPETRSRYRYVTLYKNNVGTKITVHRLVAKAFVPNPKNYPYVLHKKNDRENNTAENLKWGTQEHNIKDAIRDGTYQKPPTLRGNEQHNAKLTPEKVIEIRKIRDSGKHFTQEGLASQFGISRGTLRSVLADKHWRHVL